MFESLTERLTAALKKISGRGVLRPEDVEVGLREVRLALLEADVNFKVVKEFVDRVRARLQGVEVAPGLTAPQQVVKAVNTELVELLGGNSEGLRYAPAPPTVLMLVGLQGSGKTTTAVKLALLARREGHRPLVAALDLRRPAAVEQLKTLAGREQVAFFSGQGVVEAIAAAAIQEAKRLLCDVVILDTAGRLHVDAGLMQELKRLKAAVPVTETLLVADSMTGQEAVKVGEAFGGEIGLDGVILTKLDGDARGGAALSIKEVTGKPIKFLGMGESLDKLEEFRPEGLASRILGMGDIVGLMKDFEEVVDAEKAEEDAVRMLKGKFDMQDFLEQIRMIQKMGSLKDLFEKMPFFPGGLPEGVNLDDKELVKIEAMISSMTMQERTHPEHFVVTSWEMITSKAGIQQKRRAADYDEKRVKRVARGSGRKEQEVKELLNKFAMMRQMMTQMGQQSGLLGKIPGFRQIAQMKKMAGIDLSQIMNAAGMQQGERKFSVPRAGSNNDKNKEKRKRKEARKQRKKNKKR